MTAPSRATVFVANLRENSLNRKMENAPATGRPPRVRRGSMAAAMRALAVAALVGAAVPAGHAQVVKCVDANGRVEYAKTCSPGTTRSTTIQSGEAQSPPRREATPASAARAATPAKAGGNDPATLDRVEDLVCTASRQAAAARSGLADTSPVPVEQLNGRPIEDPRKREALQRQVDSVLRSTQQSIVDDAERSLARYQAEYRRLTGSTYDVRLCDDNQRRIDRRVAWEERRVRDEAAVRAEGAVASEDAAVREICGQRQRLDMLPRGDPPESLPGQMLTRAQATYDSLLEAYARKYRKSFDTRKCQ